jgi:hypothetical protein
MSRKPTAEDFNRINGSKYLSKDEVGDDEVTTAITDVVIEQVREKDGSLKEKFVVSFDAFGKPLVLNTTNKRFLGDTFGKDPNDWPGNQVVIFVDTAVIFQGIRGGIRLRLPPKLPKKSVARKPGPAPTDPGLNDDIPFDNR